MRKNLFQRGKSGNPGGRKLHGLSVSDHVKDLLKRDYSELRSINEYLENKGEEELGNVTVSRLLARRLIFSALSGQAEMFRQLLDRTEGKVADKLITVDLNDMVRQLEAARQRVLSHAAQLPASVDGVSRLAAPEAGILPGEGLQEEATQT